eukprot:13556987-Alexandrium_andersonii.AAC.1
MMHNLGQCLMSITAGLKPEKVAGASRGRTAATPGQPTSSSGEAPASAAAASDELMEAVSTQVDAAGRA